MIQVIYHWTVDPEKFQHFQKVWKSTTNHIHQNVEGALGSKMFRSIENPSEVKTIAKWRSLDDWSAFWEGENPKEMSEMRLIGHRSAVDVFEEVEVQTYS